MISEVIARLMEAGTPFKMSGGAGELADVKDMPRAMPAAFVFVSSERSAGSERVTGRVLQETMAEVTVVLITKNLAKLQNAAAVDDVDALKIYVRKKLLGFSPNADTSPLEHVSGELVQAIGGTVWFEDVFKTTFYQEEET